MNSRKILVVGAGLAGLTCALTLRQRGLDPLVLEASARVGGRMGSLETVEGHRIDRGFQVLFTNYPALKDVLDLPALRLHPMDAGAIVRVGGRFYEFANPLHNPNPWSLWKTIQAPFISFTDKLLVARMTVELAAMPNERILHGKPLGSIREYLERTGFSRAFIEQFIRPFFSGIFLSEAMAADARLFRYYWKMLVTGSVTLPEQGMQAIPDQLARRLGPERIRLGAGVVALRQDAGRIVGVRLASGEVLEADAVVLAVDYPALGRFVELSTPFVGHATTNLYFDSPKPLLTAKKILLNGNPEGLVDVVCQISNISPAYAPPGRHQIVIQLFEASDLEDEALARRIQDEIASWVPDHDVRAWKPLKVLRIPFGQYRQDPATLSHLPGPRLGEGLYLASELLVASNYDGAIRGGQLAAEAILADERRWPAALPQAAGMRG